MTSTRLTEQLNTMLSDAAIPALSIGWRQGNKTRAIAGGVTDTAAPIPVDNATLFQAASIGKPVSSAIVLDLVEQRLWDLDTPLADLVDYGPPEIRLDPHYRQLTTRTVIGQCSGLPNWFSGEDNQKFLIEPGKRFIYSGLALEFLKEVITKTLIYPWNPDIEQGRDEASIMHHRWEQLAQAFFEKAGMQQTTYLQSEASRLYGADHVAREHLATFSPIDSRTPKDSEITYAAGSLLTTATDYIAFLSYCFSNPFLKSTLLTGSTPLGDFPETPGIENHIQWGLGMGIYQDEEKTLAFHWGNNTGSHAFCAMNSDTGDCIACFVNSENGPNVFQALSEVIVGEMRPLFSWLSRYCAFNAASPAALSSSPADLIRLANDQYQEGDRLAISGKAMQGPGIFSNGGATSTDSSVAHKAMPVDKKM